MAATLHTPESAMAEAIALAEAGMRANRGGPFGAVLLREGHIVATGENRVTSTNDPTAHAEIVVIRAACAALGAFQLPDCVMVTSCEPCPMCLAALYWAGIPTVYYAATRDDAHAIGFSDALLYEELPKPPEQRRIRFVQLDRARALAAFAEWQAKPDKIVY